MTVTALRLHCATCDDHARLDARVFPDLAEPASAWWVAHLAPELAAVEVDDGEWVPCGT